MGNIESNYKVEAIKILLNEDCILSRYYPLIPFKNELIEYFLKNEIFNKNDCLNLNNDFFLKIGLPNVEMINLFKRFLIMYDKKISLKQIKEFANNQDEIKAYCELYMLPGVKKTRALLYYMSGYKSLLDIANSKYEEIIIKTKNTIDIKKLKCIVPLIKEVKTHIAVAKAFTLS